MGHYGMLALLPPALFTNTFPSLQKALPLIIPIHDSEFVNLQGSSQEVTAVHLYPGLKPPNANKLCINSSQRKYSNSRLTVTATHMRNSIEVEKQIMGKNTFQAQKCILEEKAPWEKCMEMISKTRQSVNFWSLGDGLCLPGTRTSQ